MKHFSIGEKVNIEIGSSPGIHPVGIIQEIDESNQIALVKVIEGSLRAIKFKIDTQHKLPFKQISKK